DVRARAGRRSRGGRRGARARAMALGDERRPVGGVRQRRAARQLDRRAGGRMATMKNCIALLAFVAGCGDLNGFGGEVVPLATIHIQVTGDLDAVRVTGATGDDLRVALVWGT